MIVEKERSIRGWPKSRWKRTAGEVKAAGKRATTKD